MCGPVPEPERTSQPLDSTLLELVSSTRVESYLPHGDSNWWRFQLVPTLSTSIRTYLCTYTAQLVDPESYSSLAEWLLTSGREEVLYVDP